MIIGIDLDNTIISYDRAFISTAESQGIPVRAGNKKKLRDKIRCLENGENLWRKLQKEVYGRRFMEAEIIKGFKEFITAGKKRKAQIYIVSHKTKYLSSDKKINFRKNSLEFLRQKGFFSKPLNLAKTSIYFEASRKAKIARIRRLNCDYFIDDLEEVFADKDFPAKSVRILLGKSTADLADSVIVIKDWYAITKYIFA